jgi:hypothetical protein
LPELKWQHSFGCCRADSFGRGAVRSRVPVSLDFSHLKVQGTTRLHSWDVPFAVCRRPLMQQMSAVPPPPEQPPFEEADESPPPEITGFPVWIKAAGVVILGLLIVSVTRLGPVFSAAVNVEKGQRHLESGEFAKAASELKPVVSRYPASIDLQLDLAKAQIGAGEVLEAAKTMEKLGNVEVTKAQADRGDEIMRAIDAAIDNLEKGPH